MQLCQLQYQYSVSLTPGIHLIKEGNHYTHIIWYSFEECKITQPVKYNQAFLVHNQCYHFNTFSQDVAKCGI